jgi:hypothetical protein
MPYPKHQASNQCLPVLWSNLVNLSKLLIKMFKHLVSSLLALVQHKGSRSFQVLFGGQVSKRLSHGDTSKSKSCLYQKLFLLMKMVWLIALNQTF